MKKIYFFVIAALTSITGLAQPTKSILKNMEAPLRLKHSVQSIDKKHIPAKVTEDSSWGEWELTGTGTFNLDDGLEVFLGLEEWVGSFEGKNVYMRTNSENPSSQQFKFEGIYNGADIIVDYDATTSLCKVMPQPTNIDAFGMPLDVVDFGTLFELHGEDWLDMSPEEAEEMAAEYGSFNYYIPELGRFYLYLGYITEGMEDALAITDSNFQLDGIEDMSVSIKADAFYKDLSDMNCTVSFQSAVAECRYGCFEGILTQKDINDVLENASGVKTIEKSGEVALSADNGNGMYTIVAITFSENGAPLEWDYAQYTYTTSSSEGWTSLGEATYKSDIFESLFEIDIPAYKVKVERNIENPSLYRVVNPYGGDYPYPELSMKAEGFDIYIVFDTTDPNKVFFKPTNLGIDTGGGWWIAANYGYFTEEINGKPAPANSFGKLSDNVITFPKNSVLTTCEHISIFGGEDGKWYYGNDSGTLSLTLPDESAVESLSTINEETTEYFNLQGLRLTKPQKGSMVIERKGSSTVKKVIR